MATITIICMHFYLLFKMRKFSLTEDMEVAQSHIVFKWKSQYLSEFSVHTLSCIPQSLSTSETKVIKYNT